MKLDFAIENLPRGAYAPYNFSHNTRQRLTF